MATGKAIPLNVVASDKGQKSRQIGKAFINLDGNPPLSITIALDSVLRILFASLGAGLMAYFMLYELSILVPTEKVWGIFSQGLIAGLIGLSGYWLLGWLLKMEEMSIFVSSMKRKLFKSAVVMAEDNIGKSDNC